jgi:hypothetical protein
MSYQAVLLPKDSPIRKSFWQNFFELPMPILLFSPVQIIMRHPLLVVHVIQQLIPIFIGLFFEPFKQSSKLLYC